MAPPAHHYQRRYRSVQRKPQARAYCSWFTPNRYKAVLDLKKNQYGMRSIYEGEHFILDVAMLRKMIELPAQLPKRLYFKISNVRFCNAFKVRKSGTYQLAIGKTLHTVEFSMASFMTDFGLSKGAEFWILFEQGTRSKA